MRLGSAIKRQLIDNIEQVYLGYLALDFSKTKAIISMHTNPSPLALIDFFRRMRTEKTTRIDILIAGKVYIISLKQVSKQSTLNEFTLTIERPVQTSPTTPVPIQMLGQYTDDQIADLYDRRTFKMCEDNEGNIDIGLPLQCGDKKLDIGGAGKLDLYRTHLVTLFNIRNKLTSETDLTALLVALATGSGKTFVQALWMEVLYLSNVTAIFGVPDELIAQFIKDMRKVLPNSVVNEMFTLRKPSGSNRSSHSIHQDAQRVLQDLDAYRGAIVIADSARLLDNHHQNLLSASGDTTFLCIDEQHLLMSNERRRKRLLALPNHMLSLFLTATPDRETFEISGSRPVASMSNAQKAAAGQGSLPKYDIIETPFFSDLNRKHATTWWQRFKNSISIGLPNLLIPEISSAAQFAIERLPFHFDYTPANPAEEDFGARWNLHCAVARKMLFIVGDDAHSNESVVNFVQYLQDSARGVRLQHIAGNTPEQGTSNERAQIHRVPTVYSRGAAEHNGAHELMRFIIDGMSYAARDTYRWLRRRSQNQVERSTRLPLWGAHELIAKERAAVWNAASQQLPDAPTKAMMKEMVDRGLVAQLKSNMFHALIEFVLNDLTGLDSIQLDGMRKHRMHDLITLVRHKSSLGPTKNTAYYENILKQKIGPIGAQDISPLLATLFKTLQDNTGTVTETRFIDNWFLDRSLMEEMVPDLAHARARHSANYHLRNEAFNHQFIDYTEKYMLMGIMADMSDAETPIENSRPFLGLTKGARLAFEKGRMAKGAKRRQRNSIQMLQGMIEGQLSDDEYTPKYLDISLEQYNEYLAFGFGGVFISNIHGKGYSDLNLHTVVNLAEQSVSSNNSPVSNLQISGRLRSLNPQVRAHSITVMGNHQRSYFKPKLLERDNYYVHYFQGQEKYNEECIDLLGINLAKKIKDIYFSHKACEEGIDTDAIHEDIVQEIALYLRELNNRNTHNLSLSRKQLARVVAKAMSVLDDDISQLRNPYKISSVVFFFIRSVVSTMLNIFSLINFRQNRKIDAALSRYQASLNAQQSPVYAIYIKWRGQNRSQHISQILEKWSALVPNTITASATHQDSIQREIVSQYVGRSPNNAVGDFLEPLRATAEAYATLSRDELIVLLEYNGCNNAGSRADKLIQLRGILSADDSKAFLVSQFAQDSNLTEDSPLLADDTNVLLASQFAQDSNLAEDSPLPADDTSVLLVSQFAQNSNLTEDSPLLCLIKDSISCSQALQDGYKLDAQKRINKAYLKIVRHTQPAEILGKAAPLAELLAWAVKTTSPLRIALGKHLVKHNAIPAEELDHMMQGMSQLHQNSPKQLPTHLQSTIHAFEHHVQTLPVSERITLSEALGSSSRLDNPSLEAYKQQIQRTMKWYELTTEDIEQSQKKSSFVNSIPSELKLVGQLLLLAISEAKQALNQAPSNTQPDNVLQTQQRMNELRDLISEHIAPILFHKEIVDTLQLFMGRLNNEDIQAILEVIDTGDRGQLDPVAKITHIRAILNIIQQKDMHSLMTNYIEPFIEAMASNDKNPPVLLDTLERLHDIGRSILNAALHFSSSDMLGSETAAGNINDPFLKAVSEPLRNIRLPYRQIVISQQQGRALLTNISNLGNVAGDANGDDIRFLKRIKNHILRPIWWTTNLSQWAFSVVEKAKDIAFWCRDLAFTIWNKGKELIAWVQGHWRNFRASKKNTVSTTYDAETFKAVRAMNALTPLTPAEVAEDGCVNDAIVPFEEMIATKKAARLRMFDSSPEHVAGESTNDHQLHRII